MKNTKKYFNEFTKKYLQRDESVLYFSQVKGDNKMQEENKMTIDTFIRNFKEKHPDDHYFDPDTLKFWGERISEMSILKDPVKISDIYGEEHTAHVLSKKMKDWNGKRIRVHDYFDVDTLERIIR